MEKLNPYFPRGIYISFRGRRIERYWEDIGLHDRYINGEAFISEVVRKYSYVQSDYSMKGRIPSVTPDKIKEDEKNFKFWITKEISHKELRACFERSNNALVKDARNWLDEH